jgi:hypothetical protein
MLRKAMRIIRENWVFITIAILFAGVLALFARKEKYMEGCSTCSLGDAGVLPGTVHTMKQIMDLDKEIAGCSTCDAGDAGVLEDTETTPETEIYNMPDEYYGSDVEVADTIAEVADNPDVIDAVVEDRENEYMSPMQFADTVAQIAHHTSQNASPFTDNESSDLMSIDPIDYALQSDAQLVNDFYGDDEIDYNERERIAAVKAMPIDFYMDDSAFTLLS